jgi:hypothetical protein
MQFSNAFTLDNMSVDQMALMKAIPRQTTLYDLMMTLQDETHDDDELITSTIVHGLQSGQIRFLGNVDAVQQIAAARAII